MTNIVVTPSETHPHQRVVVPVADLVFSARWYERLLGRLPERPNSEASVSWLMPDGDELVIEQDKRHAGEGLIGLAVNDLNETRVSLKERGIALTTEMSGRAFVTDPSGNEVVFREG